MEEEAENKAEAWAVCLLRWVLSYYILFQRQFGPQAAAKQLLSQGMTAVRESTVVGP